MAKKLLKSRSSIQEQVEVFLKPELNRSFSSSSFTINKKSKKRTVEDVLQALQDDTSTGKSVKSILIRVDFNVPMSPFNEITDDSRIRGALSTIKQVLKAKHNAILVSHMGRPKLVQKGGNDDATKEQRKNLSLRPVAEHLAELLNLSVRFASDCIGPIASDAVLDLPKNGGAVLVLENLRFYKQEEKNDIDFARSLASLADAYINDAFGTSHRAHASVAGVPAMKSAELCGIGNLIASELSFLDFSNLGPFDKVTAIIGGSKVSTKLPVIRGLLEKVDSLILGGGLAFTFLKSQGVPVGRSLVEESMLETAKDLMLLAESRGVKIFLQVDAVCSQTFPTSVMHEEDTKTFDTTLGSSGIEDEWMGLDIGPNSLQLFKSALEGVSKVVMNGPMGVFEMPPFHNGTLGLIEILGNITKEGTITVVGGGDSVAALEMFDKTDDVSYVSTGGGATLELLSGINLPGVAAISDKYIN